MDTVLVNKDFYVKIETEVFDDASGFSGYYVNEKTDVQIPMPNSFEEIIDDSIPSPAHQATVDITTSPLPSPAVISAGEREIPVSSNTLQKGEIFDDGSGNKYRIKESLPSYIRIIGTLIADINNGTILTQVGNTGIYKSKLNILIPGTYICVVQNLQHLISRSHSITVITLKKGFV